MTTEMDGLNYRTSNHHGDKLRLLLRAKGVNQEAFAKSIGISRGYLQHILNKKKFQPEFIIAVCTELKIPASSFPEVDVDLSGILKEHSDDEIKKDLELKMLRIRVKDLEEINKLLKEKLNSGKNGSATTAKKG
jgi:transcriptional regulator with XRE-family HTH domain